MSTTSNRVPPNNLEAERSVVGAMLLSRDAIETARHIVSPEDFYRPSHGVIFQAIVGLHAHGAKADPVTVAEAITRAHDADTLTQLGGPGELLSLMSNAPGTANAGHYAKIVADHAVLRALIGAAYDIMERAYSLPDEVGDAADWAKTRIAEATAALQLGEARNLYQLDWFLDSRKKDRAPWVIPGILRRRWRVIIVAPEGIGKALALDTPLPTPNGWTTMGQVAVGDQVFDSTGRQCTVTFATHVQHRRQCFEVEFSDGSVIVADADHRWVTHTVNEREQRKPWQERTTAEIAATLRVRGGGVANHSVPACGPLDHDETDLPVDPYLLGAWLGDGVTTAAAISSADDEILDAFRDGGYTLRHRGNYDYGITGARRWDRSQSFETALRTLGVLGNKHVPGQYQRASVKQRLALLQGLMDTDGHIAKNGTCEFTSTNRQLAADTHELIIGLGHKSTIAESGAKLHGVEVSRRWRITFRPREDLAVFRLTRKAARLRPSTPRANTRYIVDVRPVDSVPVRCIQVDSPDNTYLAGRSCIPTHNTMVFRQLAMHSAQGKHPFTGEPMRPITTLIVDLENPDDVIVEQCVPIRARLRAGMNDPATQYTVDRSWLMHRDDGINIRTRSDRNELESAIAAVRPDLVALGPLYKVFRKRPRESDEDAALDTCAVLDDLRVRYDFALAIEHHAPKGQNGVRDLDGFGSVQWKRWPELGLKLVPDAQNPDTVEVGRNRRDRVKNLWPAKLTRGLMLGARPWEAHYGRGILDERGNLARAVARLDEDIEDPMVGKGPVSTGATMFDADDDDF